MEHFFPKTPIYPNPVQRMTEYGRKEKHLRTKKSGTMSETLPDVCYLNK